MDIVYPLGKGSKLNDFELRFSLRSVEANLSGVSQVWIIGERPEWIQNVRHLPAADRSAIPDFNIMHKVATTCAEPDLSENFLFMNDDHFILKPFEVSTFPAFNQGALEVYVKTRGMDSYGKRAANTLKTLQTLGLQTKYFDIHTPILYNKALFLKNIPTQDWSTDGFIIKSLYANMAGLDGTEMKDNKINHPPSEKDLIFSTYPHLKSSITRYLQDKFPVKSKYERTDI